MKKYIMLSIFISTSVFAFSLSAGKVLASPPHEINAAGRILGPDDLGVFQDAPNPTPNLTTLVSASWAYDTKPGHFLIATLIFRGGSGVTITPPTVTGNPWTLAVRSSNDNPNSSGIPISTAIYYIKNADVQHAPTIIRTTINGNVDQPAPPSQQTPVYSTWTLNAPHIEAALSLGEYSGIDANAPLDVSGSDVSNNNITIGSTGLTDPVRYTNEFVYGSIAVANRGNGFDGDQQQDLTDISVYPNGYINNGYNYFGAGTGSISYKDATTPSPKDTDTDLTKGVANINISNVNSMPIGTKIGVKFPIMAGKDQPVSDTNPPYGLIYTPIPLNPVAWAGAIATFKTNDNVGSTGGGSVGGPGGMAPFSFTRDLMLGTKGDDVTALQKILEKGGFFHLPNGNAYGYFGGLTKAALIQFQLKNGIMPAVGYFGSKSKKILSK